MRGFWSWFGDNIAAPVLVNVLTAVGIAAGLVTVGYLALRYLGVSWDDFSSVAP